MYNYVDSSDEDDISSTGYPRSIHFNIPPSTLYTSLKPRLVTAYSAARRLLLPDLQEMTSYYKK